MSATTSARHRGRVAVAVGAVLLLLGIGGVAALRGTAPSAALAQEGRANRPAQRPALPASPVLTELENAFTAIADRMEPSVVTINVERNVRTTQFPRGLEEMFPDFGGPGQGFQFRAPREGQPFRARGSGSGVIVRSDGWILTNDHVVGDAEKVKVKLSDGRELEGTVRRDYRSDLAMVKVQATGLAAADLGDSSRVRVGQWAVAFGAPYELSDTMTVGIVSALHRQTTIGNGADRRSYGSLIQTDAAINPGNSGGPLLDIRGRVIGINVAINSPTGASVGIGFAIPANTARMVMDQLINSGRVTRGYLGVGLRSLTEDDRTRYGVRQGALVAQVEENTPAARAGLQVEDVVTKANGQTIEDFPQLSELIAASKPGSKVDLTVRRGGKDVPVSATLDTMPESVANSGMAEPRPANPGRPVDRLGARVEPLTAAVAERLKLGALRGGLAVVEVAGAGMAADAGLQPGDVITRVNGRAVNTPDELSRAVGDARSGSSVTFVVQRGTSRLLLSAQVP